jgi:DNA-binding transcriptional MerR regulator
VRIGELAEQAGASVRSLRYYEEQGLLRSERSPSGQRLYDDHALERVRLLKRLYAAGLTSAVIAEVLPCTYAPSIATNDHAYERMKDERDRLASHISELQDTLRSLDEVIAVNREWRVKQEGAVAASA